MEQKLKSNEYEEETEIFICDRCGCEVEEGDETFFEEEYLCCNCLEQYTFICHDCGIRHWSDEGHAYDADYICNDCYYYSYTACDDCGRIIHNEDAHYLSSHDDYGYCESCFNDRMPCIHEYDYKPEPIFYGSGLFYGVELEVDEGGEDHDNAQEILRTANKTEELIYIKRDGSLKNGFEIVTHPMSLEFHQNQMPWQEILNIALSMGYSSHNCSTCGLHVHVGREALGNTYELQEEAIGRILYFIEAFWDKLLIFSRRTNAQIVKWANRYGLLNSPKETLRGAKQMLSNRYVCLNLRNCSTIEFRMFRGTLKYQSFIAVIQLVDAICKLAINLDDKSFQALTWEEFTDSVNKTEKLALLKYMKSKQLVGGK